MGFIHNWSILAFCRLLLGCLEGGVLPGVTFTIACWYTRQELHKRISCAYALGIIASALAGILSYGLGSLGGVNGMNGWRWIFSIEGGISMAIGLIAPFFVPKFPDHTKWIKPDEKVYLYNKLDKDRGAHTTDMVTWSSFVETSKDWTLWAQGTIYCFNVGTANATAFFTPTIIKVSASLLTPAMLTRVGHGLFWLGCKSAIWISILRRTRLDGHHSVPLRQVPTTSFHLHIQFGPHDHWFHE
jgi:MFS family permease